MWSNPERAAHYREQAIKLRQMAEAEPPGKIRDQLLDLADQYEGLAKSVTQQQSY